MENRLYIDPAKCIGCKTCELACAFSHNGSQALSRSRINVVNIDGNETSYYPIVCLQCESAACEQVCPVSAIHWNDSTGVLEVDNEKCIKCLMCITACPFGNMLYDNVKLQVVKCDLCKGNPVCAIFCPTNALEYKSV